MVSITTEHLKRQSEVLNREALHYEGKFFVLEESISWIKGQDFDEVNEIYRVLARQYDELKKQKKELHMLAEALTRVCDLYERTEKRIIESGEVGPKFEGHIEYVDLEHIRIRLSELGLHMVD